MFGGVWGRKSKNGLLHPGSRGYCAVGEKPRAESPRSDPWSPFSEIILAKMSRRENGIVSHKRRYHLPLPSRLGEGGQD